MSAVFTQSVAQLLSLASNPLTINVAFSMFVYVKTSTAQTNAAFSLGSSSADQSYSILPWTDGMTYFQAAIPGTSGSDFVGYTNNVWTAMLLTSSGVANRVGRVGGSTGGGNTTSVTFTSALDRLSIGGRLHSGSVINAMVGRAAEPTIWTGVLSGGNITTLFGGAAPESVDSGNVVFHEHLYSGAGSLTNTGTVTFDTGDHPISRSAGAVFRGRSVCIGI
jgi:hypothetical protein